jgi:L-Ala-D/L-Glu epimerase
VLITSVRARPLSLRHIPQHQTAFTTYNEITNVLVEIETDAGLTGLGEGALIPQHLGEDQFAALRLVEERFAPLLIGMDPFDTNLLHRRLRRAVAEGKGARSAIDLALLDLQGKHLQVPLYTLFGGKVRDSFPTATGIGFAPAGTMVEELEKQLAAGFTSFEVKMSGEPRADLERCLELVRHLPHGVVLMLDPNEGWTVTDTIAIGRRLAPFGHQLYFEQPVRKENVSGMAAARRAMPVPIIAHEPVTSSAYAYELVKAEAADVINVTIARLGSMRACFDVIAIAAAAGLSYRIDAPIQSRLGDSALAHLGIATDHVLAACDTHLNVECPLTMHGGLAVDGETVTVPDTPGIGVELELG